MSLEKLIAAVGNQYSGDATRAGVVVSQLVCGSWYVSCARYQTGPNYKTIVCSAKGDTYKEAVAACTLAWLVLHRRTPSLARELDVTPAQFAAACARAL